MRWSKYIVFLLLFASTAAVAYNGRGHNRRWRNHKLSGGQALNVAPSAGPNDMFATFLGSTPGVAVDGEEEARSCDVMASGQFLAGALAEDNTPTPRGWDTSFNGAGTTGLRAGDSWVGIWDPDLRRLRTATYIGGSSTERGAYSVFQTPDGDIYACGHTESSDMPTTVGAYQTTFGGDWDGYCARFNSTLTSLQDLSYFGGVLQDAFRGGATWVEATSQILVSGKAVSTGLSTTGAHQAAPGGGVDENVWALFNQDLSSVDEADYNGSASTNTTETFTAVKFDPNDSNALYAFGQSPSPTHVNATTTTGPTDGTIDSAAQVMSYLIRYENINGTRTIDWATIPAAAGTHSGAGYFADVGMVFDSSGNIYVTGSSGISTLGFGVTDAQFPNTYSGGGDCLISKVSPTGTVLWARWIGGTGSDVCNGLVIDQENGVIWTAGYTDNVTGLELTSDAKQRTIAGSNDGMLIGLDTSGRVVYGDLFGGTGDDRWRQICRTPTGDLFLVGRTDSTWVPGLDAPAQSQFGGGIRDHLYAVYKDLPTSANTFYYEEQFEGGTCAALGFTVTSGTPNCQYTTNELSGTQSAHEPAGTSVAMVNAADIFSGIDVNDIWFSARYGVLQPIGASSGRIWLFSNTAGSTAGGNRTGPSIIVGAANPNEDRISVWCEHDATSQIADEGGTERFMASGEHVFVGQWDQTNGLFRLWLDPDSTEISDLAASGSFTPTGAGLDNYWEIACSDPSGAQQPEAWGWAISDFTADTPELTIDEVKISGRYSDHPGSMVNSWLPLRYGPDTKLLLLTGQSLTTGTDASPALTTTQPFDSIFATSPYGALVETAVETPLSSAVEQLRSYNTYGHLYAASTDGAGGNTITELRASVTYTNLIGRPATYIAANGPAEVAALLFIQGHSDGSDGCGVGNCVGVYEPLMEEFRSTFETNVIDDTKQRRRIPMFAIQASSAAKSAPTFNIGFSVMQAQFNAMLAYDNITLVGARYHFGSTATPHYDNATAQDGVHIGNTGQRLMAEYIGEALHRAELGTPWKPLYPVEAYVDPDDNTKVEVVMHSPCLAHNTCSGAPLVIDTTNVRAVNRSSGNTTYGLSLNDPNTKPRAIESVTVKASPNNSILVVQLDGSLQENSVLGFADIGDPLVGAGNGFSTVGGGDRDAPRTNIRDSNNVTGVNSLETLYNYAIHARVNVDGGAAGAASVATLIDDIKWDWVYTGTDGNPAGSTWVADVGGVNLTLQGISTAFDVNLGTLSAPVAAIGSTRENEAWAFTGTNASFSATDTLFDTATDEDLWIRWIGDCTQPAAIQALLWYGSTGTDPDEYYLQLQTSGTLTGVYESNGGNITNNFASALPAGPGPNLCLIDWYIDKVGPSGNVTNTLCVNGSCDVATGASAGGSNDGEPITLGGARNNSQPTTNRIIAIMGKKGAGCDGHNGFSEARHLAYATLLGVAP